jgi:hypothetical protein
MLTKHPLAFGIGLGILASAVLTMAVATTRQPALPTPPTMALTCTDVQSMLVDFCEKTLDADRHQQVETHLVACGPCNQAYLRISGNVATETQNNGQAAWSQSLLAAAPARY